MSYRKLFDSGQIGSLTLCNRIVFPALDSSFAEPDGTAGKRIIRYSEERARGGCGPTGLTTADFLSSTKLKEALHSGFLAGFSYNNAAAAQ